MKLMLKTWQRTPINTSFRNFPAELSGLRLHKLFYLYRSLSHVLDLSLLDQTRSLGNLIPLNLVETL